MGKKHPGIDAYIAKSADFAKPILKRLRKTVHAACSAVEEDLKWGFPHFLYKGMLCSMAAFKAHCQLRVLARFVLGGDNIPNLVRREREAWASSVGLRMSPKLPDDKLLAQYIKAAMQAERRRHQTEEAGQAEAQSPAEDT